MRPPARIPHTISRARHKPDLRRAATHLAYIRQLPCMTCGRAPPNEAAHVRRGTDGATGVKPSDRFALPLCPAHHSSQHRRGELTFWSSLGIDPVDYAN